MKIKKLFVQFVCFLDYELRTDTAEWKSFQHLFGMIYGGESFVRRKTR